MSKDPLGSEGQQFLMQLAAWKKGWSGTSSPAQVEGKEILGDEVLYPQVVKDRRDSLKTKVRVSQPQDTIKDSIFHETARFFQAQAKGLGHNHEVPNLRGKRGSDKALKPGL